MDILVKAGKKPSGKVTAPASKSEAHRMLICAALSSGGCVIHTSGTNDDINATVSCLNALGARIVRQGDSFTVEPIWRLSRGAELDCGESGSTLRFLLPVAAALGADAVFKGRGRLPQRPLSPLYELMSENGVKLGEKGKMPLPCSGKLTGGHFRIDGGISSQFITGLLLAAPLMGENVTVEITGRCESSPYIDITVAAMRAFGIDIRRERNLITVCGKYRAPSEITVGGDWSAAAFWLTAGALSDSPVRVYGLAPDSTQGDRAVVGCLKGLGAGIVCEDGCFVSYPSKLTGGFIDCADNPDLFPVLAVAASFASGKTVFGNTARLRTKESDRVKAVASLLESFGIEYGESENSFTVYGGKPRGCIADSFGDHRIAMSAALLAVISGSECEIKGADCVSKSYPAFFEDLARLTV